MKSPVNADIMTSMDIYDCINLPLFFIIYTTFIHIYTMLEVPPFFQHNLAMEGIHVTSWPVRQWH